MLEFVSSTANILLVETKSGVLRATCEVVLVVAEPAYALDAGGIVKSRPLSTLRFAAGIDGLKGLAEGLRELTEQAESLEARARLAPDTAAKPEAAHA